MKTMLKIGVVFGFVLAAIVGTQHFLSEQKTPLKSAGRQLQSLPRARAAIVYFEYEPDPNNYEDQQLKLQLERRTDNQLYLVDNAKTELGRHVYYAVNGAVNSVDARILTQKPLLPNRWIHLVKYTTEVSNINSESWLTSAFNVAAGQAKYAAVAEVMFWIRDSLAKTPDKLAYTQPLWPHNGAMGDVGIFKQTPAFVLPDHKRYGSESMPREEPLQNLKKVSWNTRDDKFRLMYAGEVAGLIQHMGAKNGRGITKFDTKQLDEAAKWLANSTPAAAFSVDFEPGNVDDGWHWDMGDPNFRKTMYDLSERIYKKHGKLFYSWISEPLTFDFQGQTFRLDGYANDSWSGGKKNIDDYLAIHQNPKLVQNIQIPHYGIMMAGFGYTSSTVNTDDSQTQPAHVWKAPVNWYLRNLDMLNLKSLVTPPHVKILNFIWPHEDKPQDARRSYTRRFKIGNNTQGHVRQRENRVMYPMNLVRDAVFVHLCNPRIFYTNYWLFGESYNPYQTLRYANINGTLSCLSQNAGGFFVYEYQGKDTPACPKLDQDYVGKDALGVAAMVQAHELFAKYQQVLDGNQVRESYVFEYQRSHNTKPIKAIWQNDTGEFARAFKHNQPWLQVWKHPKTGKRLLLFQDNFADAFEPITFNVVVDGKKIVRQTIGNQLYTEVF
ncbi:MAG: hypothetical protein EAZ32_07360 [Cytophagia bacterium]|nr:MAG: hypothetical protein EAZ46_04290 [Runella sp.]TAG21103.1 MAG: hypothetical protein EAZ38_08885 [Cytophagales bacterium]TAG40189.1 MAG: hypothetical protein EAZ32_07360 [Cytophagia bacterium]TAG81800.1 MAG: hypothetical protein EAZ22_06500 [Cytophagales bacterium]